MAGPILPFLVWNSGSLCRTLMPLLLFSAFAFANFSFDSSNFLLPLTLKILLQLASGFVTFWYPGGSRNSRASLLSWHVYFGLYIYALSVATCATGFLEKATFLQTHQIITRYSKEAILVNSMGILVVVLAGFVILGVVSPVYGNGDILKGRGKPILEL